MEVLELFSRDPRTEAVILIGEIRDGETASVAVEASLTGHLVFSTVHTNDAASTVNRLLDMGVETVPCLLGQEREAFTGNRMVNQLSASQEMRMLRKSENGPFLIHCQHGADRTGLMSAMYRMLEENWTAQEALDEIDFGAFDGGPLAADGEPARRALRLFSGRPRRVGWLDSVLLRYAVRINGLTDLVVTKLDVLDGVETVKICTGYEIEGQFSDILPVGAEELARCAPVYEELPGWQESTVGVREYARLPLAAREYLARIEARLRRRSTPPASSRLLRKAPGSRAPSPQGLLAAVVP